MGPDLVSWDDWPFWEVLVVSLVICRFVSHILNMVVTLTDHVTKRMIDILQNNNEGVKAPGGVTAQEEVFVK